MRSRGRHLGWLVCVGLLLGRTAVAQPAGPATGDWLQLPEDLPWNGATSWVAAAPGGDVLVFVRAAPYFRLFSAAGEFIRAWGEDGTYDSPHSVVYDADGFLWTTDSAGHVVHKYAAGGDVVLTLGRRGEAGDNSSTDLFNQPNHVAFDASGDVYVSDGYQNSRIVQFTSQGEFIRIIGGAQGAGPGQLQVPHGVAIDAAGRILVNDSDNQRISVFGSDGKFSATWPFPSRGGIVAHTDGRVYVSDVNAGAVNVIVDGELERRIIVDARAHGLAVAADGTIYVSDARGRRVIRIPPDGLQQIGRSP